MRHTLARLGLAIALAAVAACSSLPDKRAQRGPSPAVPNPHAKVGGAYQVNGVWYVPKAEPNYDRVGFASWYGPGFHGRLTANGEVFDEDRLTAAHPTLPLPSIVEVTNPKNGKRLKLRVNDRGPFANNRILDLSKEAAKQLGTLNEGVATVRVRYVGPARLEDAVLAVGERERGQSLALATPRAPLPKPEPEPEPNLPEEADLILADLDVSVLDGVRIDPVAVMENQAEAGSGAGAAKGYFVQIGAFASADNAAAAAARLPQEQPIALAGAESGGVPMTLVRMGPFTASSLAEEALRVAREKGFAEAFVIGATSR